MSDVILDDHLLGDWLDGSASQSLRRVLKGRDVATTNLYLYRLTRALLVARGGALTGRFSSAERMLLAQQLSVLPDAISVVPLRSIAFRMATIAHAHRVSTLGAEAIAAADLLDAQLVVWSGDDGDHIRNAAKALGVRYLTVAR